MNICLTVQFGKNWKLENGKKIRVLAFQKVAKTGNIGKKSPVTGDIDYIRYLSMQKVNRTFKDYMAATISINGNMYRKMIILPVEIN